MHSLAVIGIGVDIIEIDRIKRICIEKPAFLKRIYLPSECRYAMEKSSPWQHLAVRFAAKEAVAKSLGGSFSWQDVEIVAEPGGPPGVRLQGRAAAAARELGIGSIKLSLSHSRLYAVAQAMALGGVQE